jgi:hypothetical protein
VYGEFSRPSKLNSVDLVAPSMSLASMLYPLRRGMVGEWGGAGGSWLVEELSASHKCDFVFECVIRASMTQH